MKTPSLLIPILFATFILSMTVTKEIKDWQELELNRKILVLIVLFGYSIGFIALIIESYQLYIK